VHVSVILFAYTSVLSLPAVTKRGQHNCNLLYAYSQLLDSVPTQRSWVE